METEGIGLVLARATELRSKISNSIHRATSTPHAPPNGPLPLQRADGKDESVSGSRVVVNVAEDEEEERLLNICDALESLENQLSSLQVLHQQQRYEREVALAEIENSRKMLITKLSEYKGKELEVIHEASSFAGETVEHNSDLLLPPYPSRPPSSMRLDKELSQIPAVHKSVHNGLVTIDPMIEARKSPSETEQNHVQPGASNSRKGLGFFLTYAAKTVLSVAGVVTILSLSGFGPDLGQLSTRLNIQGMLQRTKDEDESQKRSTSQCPPGRIQVVENGEARCLVKERVEVPFSSVAATPDINYGCG